MILIFDLDDTLYEERRFVLSGFRAVAHFAADRWGLPVETSISQMVEILDADGRGRVFDLWLDKSGRMNRKNVADCVKIYRHHRPDIDLPDTHRALLERLGRRGPLFLVTDGHKIVQQRKVEALGLATYFRRMFITNRFGRCHAKPSLHCFEIIRKSMAADWPNLAYVGDNPAKDFVSLNAVGATTIRVRTGEHRDVKAPESHDAAFYIDTLGDLEPLLTEIAEGRVALTRASTDSPAGIPPTVRIRSNPEQS